MKVRKKEKEMIPLELLIDSDLEETGSEVQKRHCSPWFQAFYFALYFNKDTLIYLHFVR